MSDQQHQPAQEPAGGAPHEEFLRMYLPSQRQLHGYIASLLVNPADVDEVLQETSIVLWSKFDQFDRDKEFLPWACGVAHLEMLRYFRKHKRRMLPLEESVIEILAAERRTMADELDLRRAALEDCLAKLRDKDRSLIERCYQHDQTSKQVAAELNRPVNAVYKSLGRIRRWLHECIDRTLGTELKND
jgi:RNA polymerase sigma-70 factor (ECF subfamily)